MKKLAMVIALAAGSPAAAQPVLDFPLDCTLGQSCFVQNYVDRDPGPGVQDFACNARSYNGHKGTDISVNSMNDMQAGVAVFAAADGVVRGMRDGVVDILTTAPNPPDITGKECGNGVAIDHGNGWETLYCHMKSGTINVSQGQPVAAGDLLGQVGASGDTQFPHLHLQVSKDGQIIDPYAAETGASCANPQRKTLWQDDLEYAAGGLISVGVDIRVPTYAEVKQGLDQVPARSRALTPALVVWGYGYGVQEFDKITLTLTGPKSRVFSETKVHPQNQAQFYYAVGRKKPALGWPRGQYIGVVEMIRDDVIIASKSLNFAIQ